MVLEIITSEDIRAQVPAETDPAKLMASAPANRPHGRQGRGAGFSHECEIHWRDDGGDPEEWLIGGVNPPESCVFRLG